MAGIRKALTACAGAVAGMELKDFVSIVAAGQLPPDHPSMKEAIYVHAPIRPESTHAQMCTNTHSATRFERWLLRIALGIHGTALCCVCECFWVATMLRDVGADGRCVARARVALAGRGPRLHALLRPQGSSRQQVPPPSPLTTHHPR